MRQHLISKILAAVVCAIIISGCALRLDEPLLIRGTVTEKENASVAVEGPEILLYDMRGWPFAKPSISRTYTQRADSNGTYQFEITEMRGTFLQISARGVTCQYRVHPVMENDQISTIFDRQQIRENRLIEIDFVVIPIEAMKLPGCIK